MLDVGCGDGTFTIPLGEEFQEVYGIDVLETKIQAFCRKLVSDHKYKPLYLPPVHNAVSDARVFTVKALDHLFRVSGFERTPVGWLWPTFEHGGNPMQRYLRPLFPVMRRLERCPVAFLGTSIVARFAKPLASC